MIEIVDGFESYQKSGGSLGLSDYEKARKMNEGGSFLNPSSISQVETMAKRCGLELTEEQIRLYVKLRASMTKSYDTEVFLETLIITKNEEGIKKLKTFYSNLFV